MKQKFKTNVNIHNRFDIEVTDICTGEVRERYQAENIVLDQMWTRLCARAQYFVNIHFGTGTGTLAASRTTLFTHLGTKTAVNDTQSKALPTSFWRRKIVLNPEDNVGAVLSEVGIAYGATNTNLVTHAMIRDMNNNVVTITKLATDLITIYATVYCTFSTSNANISLIGLPDNNSLINFLIGNASFPSGYFGAGLCGDASDSMVAPSGSVLAGVSPYLTWTGDVSNKRCYTNIYRFAVGDANGHLKEILLLESNSITELNAISRLVLPAAGIYSGLVLTGVSVGTGNGVTQKFTLPSKNIDTNSMTIFVDGVATAVTFVKVRVDSYVKWMLRDVPFSGYSNYNNPSVISADGAVIASLCYAATPMLAVWDRVGHSYLKRTNLPDIGSLQAYTNTAPALSGDGLVLAKIDSTGACVHVYDWNSSTRVWSKRPAPAIVTGTGSSDMYALNSDGTVLIQTISVAPFYRVWDWSAGTNSWTLRAAVSGWSNLSGVAISQDGLTMAILAGGIAPYLHVYDWSGTVWVKRVDPPVGTVSGQYNLYSVRFSADKKTIVCTFLASPYFSVIDWDSGTSTWTKRADPVDLPPQANPSCGDVSNDGSVVVLGHSDQGSKVTMYNWIDGAYVKETPPTVLTNNGNVMTASVSSSGDVRVFGKSIYGPRVAIGEKEWVQINFASAPAVGAVITADYTVNGIHKTAQRVIDLQAVITFGEDV